MRIAYVITRADAVGGASVHVRDLAEAMRDRGHDVVVLVGGTGAVTNQLAARGVPFRSLKHLQRSVHPLRDFRAFSELQSELRAYKPDLVSAHTAKAGWLARAACRSLRLPVIYTPHGWSVGDRISLSHGAVYTIAERIGAAWADAIVCVSEAERRLAMEKKVASADRLHVIYNGVHDVPCELRAHPENEPVRIVSVARLEPPKDHETLLQALSKLTALVWTLELVGDGPLESKLRSLAETLGIGGRIRFSGYLQDAAHALAEAHLFVLSSRSEGFPRSVLEAMRAGLPVIASDVGGVAEAGPVRVVRSGSVQEMAAVIHEFVRHRELRRQLGSEARSVYERRFRFDRMLDETEALYRSVLQFTGANVT